MMELKQFYFKRVHIIDISGREWTGIADTYCEAEDNESGNESIIVKCGHLNIDFEVADIKEIEIIEDDHIYKELRALATENDNFKKIG